jgi:hypothetical protein
MFVPILRRRGVLGAGGHTVAAMSRLVLVVLVVAGLSLSEVGVAAGAGRWRMPLSGASVVRGFTFEPAAPYAGGQRRGLDLRGAAGARVVAACAGTVAYAGRVPEWGRGVSLRCGGLVATELGLASASVVRGARVWPGATVGRLAARGVLRLGARRVGVRQGYLDPLALLGHDGPGVPTVAPRGAFVDRSRRRAIPPRAVVAPVPALAAAPFATALSWPAGAGLALLAAGAGGGGMTRRRRRLRRRTGMALAQR